MSFGSSIAATLVWVLHVIFVLFMIVVPFLPSTPLNEPLLVLHLFVTPMLWLHWHLESDTCALSVLECHLRGIDKQESFMHSVVSPIYKISDDNVRSTAWIASFILWGIVVTKVSKRPGMITDMFTESWRALRGNPRKAKVEATGGVGEDAA